MGNNLRKNVWVFQDNATALGDGFELSINTNMMVATIEITGSGTNKVVFEGKVVNDGEFYPIMGVNLTDLTMSSSTSAKGVLYQISLEGLLVFRIRISEYTDGVVTIKGTVVD